MKSNWSKISVLKIKKNFRIYLDDKPLKTIEKNDFEFQNKKIVNLVKKEITQLKDVIKINDCFYFNILSFCFDKIKNDRDRYLNDIFKYCNTDLICYRAEKPQDLVNLQNKYWDPVLIKLNSMGLKFKSFYGVMPKKQLSITIKKFKKELQQLCDIELACLLKLTQTLGSVLLSYSLLKNQFNCKFIFECSVLDEKWQSKQWGEVEESLERFQKTYLFIKNIKNLLYILGK